MKALDWPGCEMKNLENIIEARKIQLEQMNIYDKYDYLKDIHKTTTLTKIKSHCKKCIGQQDIRDAIEDCRGFGCDFYFIREHKYGDTDKVRKLVAKKESKLLDQMKKSFSEGRESLPCFNKKNGESL